MQAFFWVINIFEAAARTWSRTPCGCRSIASFWSGPVLAVLVAIPALHQVTAAPYDWASATTGGIWSDQNNWNPNTGVPGVGDIATLVDATADRTVTYDASAPSSLDGLAFDQS